MPTLSSILETAFNGLVAGIPTVVVATFLIPKYLDYRKRPKLTVTNRQTDDDVFYFAKTADGWKASFEIGIHNSGPTAQRDWYWNLIIPESLAPQLHEEGASGPAPRSEILTDFSGKRWVRFMGRCGDAVYPGRNYLFPFRIELKGAATSQPPDQCLYYFFGTEFGLSPAGAARLGHRVRLSEAAFAGSLGEFFVKFPAA